MTGPSYPAARQVAERIEVRLATNTTAFQQPGDAPKPDAVAIEEIVSAAFWASLRREEGRAPKISLAFVPPTQTTRPLMLERRLPLDPALLARLAPAVERPAIHLGVWRYDDQLWVWGTTRVLPTWCFVLEVVSPGLLVVKYRLPQPSTKFYNVAVLEGSDVKFIAPQGATISEAPAALSALLEFYSSAGRNESDNILVQLGVSMRDHGRGGVLLVVPQDSEDWRSSIAQPITYGVTPQFSGIIVEGSRDGIRSAVEALAGLTAVDGATVISDHFELLAFGVKIVSHGPHVEQVVLTEPIEGSPETVIDAVQLGGTRHLSAAQFVHDQRNTIAMVASQDGRFTVFAWSDSRRKVHAHRLEALLF
jgi:hypothetical protein